MSSHKIELNDEFGKLQKIFSEEKYFEISDKFGESIKGISSKSLEEVF